MPGVFDQIVSRADAASLIPQQVAGEIIQAATQGSAALQLCRTTQMSTKTLVQPVLASFPIAYWVNGDTGLKQTTDATWAGVTMTAEELAAIVAIPDAVIADSGVPLWAQVQPLLAEAVARALDQAVIAGINKPATWPAAIVPAATAAGNVVTEGAAASAGGIAADVDATMGAVEGDGFDVSGFAAKRSFRGKLRGARDTTGQRLLDVSTNEIEGVQVAYVPAGTFDATTDLVAGDWSMAIVGVRQDITYKLLDQAVITDDTGKVVLNLPQQDSTAMRVVARFGYALANPATHVESGTTNPFPFAVLKSA